MTVSAPIPPPRVWLLAGHRAGDNEQITALAEGLGWPFEIKRLVYRPTELVTNLLFSATLAGIDRKRSTAMSAPWPDLVLTAGRRNEPVARWIRRQSGERARLVHVGRPWGRLEGFDLVIATPQYEMPRAANVLEVELPLHRVTPTRLAAAAEGWRQRLGHLPPPRIALLVGGDSPPYRFDADAARRFGQQAMAIVSATGGSLLVTTSARTSSAAAAALRTAIDGPMHWHDWRPEAVDNPYLSYLALADGIIVTGESVSMIAESCATGRPVYLFDVGNGWSSQREPLGRAPFWQAVRARDAQILMHSIRLPFVPARMRRDVGRMLRSLVASGRAVWLGDRPTPATVRESTDLERAVQRIHRLFQ